MTPPFHPIAELPSRAKSGHRPRNASRPRVSISRSIFPIVDDVDRQLFWQQRGSSDQIEWLDGGNAQFGRTNAGEPDKLVAELAEDEAIAAADTLLLTVPTSSRGSPGPASSRP